MDETDINSSLVRRRVNRAKQKEPRALPVGVYILTSTVSALSRQIKVVLWAEGVGLPPNLSIRLFNTVRIRLMLRFFGGQASRPILPCFAAEGVGLEPTRANRPAGFQDQFLSHSEHPSTFLWRRRRDFRQTADKLLIPPPCLAEEEGFEPS